MKTAGLDMESLKEFMTLLARKSAEYILPFFGNPDLPIEIKEDLTPVTAADRGSRRKGEYIPHFSGPAGS